MLLLHMHDALNSIRWVPGTAEAPKKVRAFLALPMHALLTQAVWLPFRCTEHYQAGGGDAHSCTG